MGICTKENVIERLDFEFIYYDAVCRSASLPLDIRDSLTSSKVQELNQKMKYKDRLLPKKTFWPFIWIDWWFYDFNGMSFYA